MVSEINFDFEKENYNLLIVNTGGNHADLSQEYSAIPNEMWNVAKFFGKSVCREIEKKDVVQNLKQIRKEFGDRAVLRAFHFFEENDRVDKQVKALKENNFSEFLSHITDSGNSSWKWLQNCYVNSNYNEQGITMALSLTELFIKDKKKGACRVHGGGFAGVILTLLPKEYVDEYINYMHQAIGENNVYKMNIRPEGVVCLNSLV
jgi:galactokinase